MSKSDSAPIDIEAEDWQTVLGVLRARVPDRDVWAFGSRANWKAKEYSDLDLAVGGEQPLSLDTLANLNDDFEVLDLPFRVDVVDLASISPEFKRRVEDTQVLVQRAAGVGFVQLKDVCRKIGSGATPRGGKDVYTSSGPVALIRSQNIYNDGFHDGGLVYIDWEQAGKLANVEVQENDVLLNITGDSVARCCMAPKRHLPARVNQHVAIVRTDPTRLDPVFLRFFLVSPSQQERMLGLASSGATRNALTKDMIESFLVPCPPIREQQAVGAILQAIEDRIELLRRANEILEAMARAIFKSWFVDFDPVRAKAQGREPEGMDAATAALFADETLPCEGGEIPKGWSIAPLGDLCRRISMGPFGSDIKTDNFIADGVPIIRGKNLGHGFVDDDFVYISEQKADQLKTANAFGGDIVITHRGTLGQVGLIPSQARFPRYVVSQSQMVLSVHSAMVPSTFVYLFLTSADGQHQLLANTSQTGVPAISRPTTSLKAIRVLQPDREILRSFDSLASAILDRIHLNQSHMRTLSDLRDTLLPRLISGKLRVPEAEKLVEAVL